MTKGQAMQTAHAYVANVLETVIGSADDPYPPCEDECGDCRRCRDSVRLATAIQKIVDVHAGLAVDHRNAEDS